MLSESTVVRLFVFLRQSMLCGLHALLMALEDGDMPRKLGVGSRHPFHATQTFTPRCMARNPHLCDRVSLQEMVAALVGIAQKRN